MGQMLEGCSPSKPPRPRGLGRPVCSQHPVALRAKGDAAKGHHAFHGAAHGYGFDLAALGNYHRQYEKLMAHWSDVLPLSIHDIVYEDLVDDLEGHVRAMLEYCELPFEEACLSFHESGRGADTASWAQVRQPLFRSSIGAWRRYEDDLAPLAKALAKG